MTASASFLALTCPQCGGPLPRQAMWRLVECPHCKAVVSRTAEVVRRGDFRAALDRSRAVAPRGGQVVSAGGASYALLRLIGRGRVADVHLGERLGAVAARVTVKIARDESGAEPLRREAQVLAALQAVDGAGAAYYSQRLPQPVHAGAATDAGGGRHHVLVTRHPTGYWGSLADVRTAQPGGVDARHVVWMWRRVLETLAWLHRAGWSHGDLAPEHLLVHPGEHGVRVIGWAAAREASGGAHARACGRDVQQLAWSMRALIAGSGDGSPAIPRSTPAPLAELLRRASDDAAWRDAHDAAAVEQALGVAATAAFGAPRFVPFDPLAGRLTASA